MMQFQGTTLEEVMRSRAMVETAIIRLAASRINADQLARLQEVSAELAEAIEDHEAFGEGNTEYHDIIAVAAENRRLPTDEAQVSGTPRRSVAASWRITTGSSNRSQRMMRTLRSSPCVTTSTPARFASLPGEALALSPRFAQFSYPSAADLRAPNVHRSGRMWGCDGWGSGARRLVAATCLREVDGSTSPW
jgi:hypothetical protein